MCKPFDFFNVYFYIRMSPMKVIKIPASGLSGSSGLGDGMPPGVKVVKLSATSSGGTNARTIYSPQVRKKITKSLISK